MPLTTQGFNATGLTLNLTLGAVPTLGLHYVIVNNTSPGAEVKSPVFPGRAIAYVTRFNADGSYAWTQTFGGSDCRSAGTFP